MHVHAHILHSHLHCKSLVSNSIAVLHTLALKILGQTLRSEEACSHLSSCRVLAGLQFASNLSAGQNLSTFKIFVHFHTPTAGTTWFWACTCCNYFSHCTKMHRISGMSSSILSKMIEVGWLRRRVGSQIAVNLHSFGCFACLAWLERQMTWVQTTERQMGKR